MKKQKREYPKEFKEQAINLLRTTNRSARKRKPATVNNALAATDNFYRFLQMSPADVKREDLSQQAHRALTEDDRIWTFHFNNYGAKGARLAPNSPPYPHFCGGNHIKNNFCCF
jgi:hypothetical protein